VGFSSFDHGRETNAGMGKQVELTQKITTNLKIIMICVNCSNNQLT